MFFSTDVLNDKVDTVEVKTYALKKIEKMQEYNE